MKATVEIPVRLLHRLVEVERSLASLSDELEDLILARDPAFLKKMRSARHAHRFGKTRSLEEFLAA